MDDAPRNRVKKRLLLVVKLLIVAVVVWYVRQTLQDAWNQLGERRWRLNFGWLAASGGLYLLGTLLCGLFWHRTLLALGQKVGLRRTLRAYYVGHLGKYVPGKAMVVILRAGMVGGHGVDAALAAVSVFFETLTMMSTGALVAAAIVAIWFSQHALLFWVALAIMFAAGLPTLPPVFRRLVRLLGVAKASPEAAENLSGIGYGLMFLGWLLTGLGWVVLGLSFWAVLRAFGTDAAAGMAANPLEQLHLYTAAVTLATVAGFVSFVPGGAVVREAVLTEFMVPYLGQATALLSAVLLRLVQIVAELIISAMLYWQGRDYQG